MTVPPPASYQSDEIDDVRPGDAPELPLAPSSAGVGAAPRVGQLRRGSAGESASEWLEHNGRTVGAALVVAAVAAAGVVAWRSSEQASAERADRALYQAEARYVQGDPGADQALQQVVSRFGGTPAGAHARVLLAQADYDQGRYADGLRALGSGSPPSDWRGATDRMRAVGEFGSGRPREAAAIYERLARDAGPETRSSLLADAARAYEAAGDREAARRTWRAVIDAGQSGAADEARVRLGELEAGAR
jgi:TolA-binding protein